MCDINDHYQLIGRGHRGVRNLLLVLLFTDFRKSLVLPFLFLVTNSSHVVHCFPVWHWCVCCIITSKRLVGWSLYSRIYLGLSASPQPCQMEGQRHLSNDEVVTVRFRKSHRQLQNCKSNFIMGHWSGEALLEQLLITAIAEGQS